MDPIAVDVPAKSPLSLGLGARPITTLNGSSLPKSELKPEAKPEPAKPPFPTPASAATGPTSLLGKSANALGFQPTRKNGLVLAAAACSLFAGIAAVKLLVPNKTNEATQPLLAEAAKTKEDPPRTTTPAASEMPVAPAGMPASPAGMPAPVLEVSHNSPSTAAPGSTPIAPTPPVGTSATTPPVPSSVPPPAAIIPSTAPPNYSSVPSASLPTMPIIPATLPPSSGDTFAAPGTSKFAGSGVPSPLPGDSIPPSIAPPSIYPASANETVVPVVPPISPTTPVVPVVTPTLPLVPATTPSAPSATIVPTLPTTVPTIPPTMPTLPVVPPAVPLMPPSLFPPAPSEPTKPLTIDYAKPAGSTEVKPAQAPDRAAVTSFDVDLHEPKNGDTYASVSKEFYNDVKYAAALQEYNRGRALLTSVRVEVPPIHILKKRYPQLIGAVVPASGKTGELWSPAGDAATPAFRATGQRTFTVPTGGMTMGSIARDTLGSPTRWRDIYDLNPSLSPGEVLPGGTVVKIPTDVKSNP